MERRFAKVGFSRAGGTAAKGSTTCKITLPKKWVQSMGITAEERNVEIFFDGNQIVISRYLCGQEFAKQKLAMGHEVFCLRFCDGDKQEPCICTVIYADFTDESVRAENRIENIARTAFGNNASPSWADFQAFLEDRCVPRSRAGLREYLEAWDLVEYDPFEIIKKTGGRMAEDQMWLEVEKLS